ncbi:hypothetical protein F5050DRAFT_1799886 [Lentinula boryana]|uniref:ferric-chelate reductase (NADPH) n=1 Tax=Lentinula boryana TaxID=40481 RepID=A0ABQ8QBM7_9AGAR|nr:hypothetical protein F5050DRAFT_1799886 [Lentinula boryana]
MSFHYDVCKPWAYGCAIIYLIDLCLRATKTRLITATVRPLRELGVTRVEIPEISSGWRAGQHVRLRVISSGMGLLGWSGMHPLTIALVADSQEGLVLICKKAGSWTNKVFDIASSGIGVGSDEKRVSVMVEGPYGTYSECLHESTFAATVPAAGGSGINLATLTTVQDLIRKSLRKQSHDKLVELIWTVQDPCITESVFYTRAPTGAFPFAEDFFRSPCLTLSPGRPKLILILQDTIDRLLVGRHTVVAF